MRFLSNKEKKELSAKLPCGYEVLKKDEIKQDGEVIYKGNDKFLIIKDKEFLPHLKSIDESCYKSVYIDKGAIPFILKGADLMKPGIHRIDAGFEKGDILIIKDENHNKTLALGFALFSSLDMVKQEKGKSVQVFHFFKDTLY